MSKGDWRRTKNKKSMPLFPDYTTHDGLGLAELVRTGAVHPRELVEAAIDRIDSLNAELNAVVGRRFEAALAEADGELPDGPFRGVPFLFKDLDPFLMQGEKLTFGSRACADFVPTQDSDLVRRYKAAGMIILGTTNTPEFGFSPLTNSLLHGPAQTPYKKGFNAGGSSGGSAAAVAAKLVPMASASDFAGSIRIPSACCGTFGLKPSRGRNPLNPFPGEGVGFLQAHVITRSVRDSAAMLDATCNAGPQGFLDAVSARESPLRVAMSTRPVLTSVVHDDCKAAVQDVAALLETLGHHVEQKDPPIDTTEFMRSYMMITSHYTAPYFAGVEALMGRKLSRWKMEARQVVGWVVAKKVAPNVIDEARATMSRLSADMDRFFESYDVLLTPATAQPPVPHDALRPKRLAQTIAAFYARANFTVVFPSSPDRLIPFFETDPPTRFMCFTPLANALGLPSMSVPLVWNKEGLPVGTVFTGRRDEEATLFRLAAQLERARPWVR